MGVRALDQQLVCKSLEHSAPFVQIAQFKPVEPPALGINRMPRCHRLPELVLVERPYKAVNGRVPTPATDVAAIQLHLNEVLGVLCLGSLDFHDTKTPDLDLDRNVTIGRQYTHPRVLALMVRQVIDLMER